MHGRDEDEDGVSGFIEDEASDEDTGSLFTTRGDLERAITQRAGELIGKLSREIATETKKIPLVEIEAGLWGESSINEFLLDTMERAVPKLRD